MKNQLPIVPLIVFSNERKGVGSGKTTVGASLNQRDVHTSRMSLFARDEEGGLIIFSLLVLVSMLVLGGMAVDFMRQENERVVLQGIADRSVLAGASLQQETAGDALVLDYFSKSGYEGALVTPPNFDDEGNTKSVHVHAKSEIDTFFLRLIGIDELTAVASAEATESVGKVEISLVIDVSGSMRGPGSNPAVTETTLTTGGRIADLRAAAKTFATTVLDPVYNGEISLNIVPYAGHTNPGKEMFRVMNGANAPAIDAVDNFDLPFDAIVPGEVREVGGALVGAPFGRVEFDPTEGHFVLVLSDTVYSIHDLFQRSADTTPPTYSGPYEFVGSDGAIVEVADGSGVLQSIRNEDIRAIVREDPTAPHNYIRHEDYAFFNDDPDDWVLNPGAGNVLEVVYDPPHACMELLDSANWTSTAPPIAGAPKVPQFMHWNTQPWEVRLQLMGYGWCPHNESSIQYAMQDAQKAVEYIDRVKLFDGTGTQNAVKWGVATLDPAMQPNFQQLNNDYGDDLLPADFVNRPAPYDDDETRKILVLMTDGRVTPQYRPHSSENTDPENLIDVTPVDLDDHDDWIGDNIQGNAIVAVSDTLAREQLVDMCNFAKGPENDKISIFTVAFEFPQPGDPAFSNFASNRQAMQDCATPEDGDTQYYFEAEGADLESVFEEIAGQISKLRLTQ